MTWLIIASFAFSGAQGLPPGGQGRVPLLDKGPTILTIEGTKFAINDQATFLLGCSYYAALSATDEEIREDLRRLRHYGFNWVRVWATWSAYGNDISIIDSTGQPRQPWMQRMKKLFACADSLGMVVDLTLTRGRELPNQQIHLAAVRTLARELKSYRNWYLDLGNERNVRDARYVSMEELAALRRAVKEVDPDRLVTASHAGDIPDGEVRAYVTVAKLDFLAPHRPRVPGSPRQTEAKTRHYLTVTARAGHPLPIHYQEPFRRNFNPRTFQPTAEDFFTDARGALEGGAAGWCLHIGDNRTDRDRRPRKDFDMRPEEGRFFHQIDDVEWHVIREIAQRLGLK